MTFEIPSGARPSRELCESLDANDPLATWRDAFALPANVVYLDGMSLGALPKAAVSQVARVVESEWGEGLIRSWNTAEWIEMPRRLGARLAPLLGVEDVDVVVADSTSVCLFKLLVAAMRLRPQRRIILTEDVNFPTNVHIARGVERLRDDWELKLVPSDMLSEAVNSDVAVVMLTHVDFRSSRLHDMAKITKHAHASGALALWDLSHSAGAMPIDLQACEVDLAVGCGYKYLNGGPGAPAYAYVAPAHQDGFDQPITGWMGHAKPFDFSIDYTPAKGMDRFLSGTPPIVALAALAASLEIWQQIDLLSVRAKSMAMSDLFLRTVQSQLAPDEIELVSPAEPSQRGGHVALRHPEGYAVVQALIEKGVIGDFRDPDLMRFGFAPLYTSFVDVWRGATALAEVIRTRAWDEPSHKRRATVT